MMPDIDWNALTLEELKQIQKDAAKAIKSFQKRKLKEARAAAEAAAKEHGFSLADLKDGGIAAKSAAAPKYQHPENSEITWSGRGRKPKWFSEALANGADENDLLI